MTTMTAKVLEMIFKQHTWVCEVRDYLNYVVTHYEIPWEPPVSAIRDGDTLIVKFEDGSVWHFTIDAEKKQEAKT